MKNERSAARVRPVWGLLAIVATAYASYCLLLAVFSDATSASANTAYNGIAQITDSGDSWYNYDFKDDGQTYPLADHVDWPVRVIFDGYANVNFIKDRLNGCDGNPTLSPQLCNNGGTERASINDTGSFQWDTDKGIKAGTDCAWDMHMRVYAHDVPGTLNDYNYNGSYGYWVLASNHLDFEGGCNPDNYFSRETDEATWRSRVVAIQNAGSIYGTWTIYADLSYQYNAEPARWWTPTSYVDSNGYVTYVNVQ